MEKLGKTVKKEMRIAMKPVEGQEVQDTVNEEKEAVSDMEITPSETDADMNLSAPAAEEDTKVPTSEEKIEEVKEEEAMQLLEQVKKKYWDARHHCWAYVISCLLYTSNWRRTMRQWFCRKIKSV